MSTQAVSGRAGVVLLGQRTRWLGADTGRRQFYRILDAVLDVGGAATASGTLAPRAALPAGAVVIAFSTLLDTSFAVALIDLAGRGPVVAVDVLEAPPFANPLEPMPARLWRVERRAMYRDLATVGVPVASWSPDLTLDEAFRVELGHLGRHRMARPRSRLW